MGNFVSTPSTRIALFAGEGKLPELIAEQLRADGCKVLVISLERTDLPAEKTVCLEPVQVGRAIALCREFGAHGILFAGRILHSRIYRLSWWKVDWQTLRIWLTLPDKRADTILSAIANAFTKKGIPVLPLPRFLRKYMAQEGLLAGPCLSGGQQGDVELGWRVAKGLGALDVGQTVAVKKGAVVAVEAMEGTDQCIERAGQLAGEGLVVVKVAKPNQDERFDMPVVGMNTIEKLIKARASVLAIQAAKTVLLDPEALKRADEAGITVVALK